MDYASIFPDQEIGKSNSTHRHFIDSLMEIFSILGGISWWDKQMEANDVASKRTTSKSPTSKRSSFDSEQIEEIKGVIFSNRFASLRFADDAPSEPQQEAESESEVSDTETTHKKKLDNKKKGKGKKAKKTGKAQKTEAKARAKANIHTNEMSPKSYRLLENDGDLMTNYTMAILTITAELSQMRHYLMNLWHEVATEGLGIVVAGAVSHVAIAKVKKTEQEVFVDFPGYECFESITAAKPFRDCPNCEVDVREKLLLYAYQDLVDFVTDFQQSRNGRPTKAMRARLGKWDPTFRLEDATKEERIKWRRIYTITYLYELVNEYSALEQKRRGSNRCFSEPVDWSPEGPTGAERRLLGMTEFAAFVTSLVTQKWGEDFQRMILPRHVFQLQCIVDATMVAQFGWMLCPHEGEDWEEGCIGGCTFNGYLSASQSLADLMYGYAEDTTGPVSDYYNTILDTLDWATNYLETRLGVSTAEAVNAPTPPSRFSHLGPNALWRYSYFLCGVGLLESLQITYTTGMRLLDLISEPTMVAHIELMLHNQGHLHDEEQPELTTTHRMRALFNRAIFGQCKVMPQFFAYDYEQRGAFEDWGESASAVYASRLSRAKTRVDKDPSAVASVFPLRKNVDYNIPSHILSYQEAGWDPSKNPNKEIPPRSAIAAIRLSRRPWEFDGLTKHMMVASVHEDQSLLHDLSRTESFLMAGIKQTLCSIIMLQRNKAPRGADEELTKDGFSKLETILEDLEAAKIDLWNDVNG
ncbi:hypothetical protein CSOJ01_07067 [Colletotrichum sojae]|uniref:DUF6604 domain-containing protein n=1 Tax=Colletotrichum sojae TaxID=2175907 RepID=A0A8H6J9R9_9PEZI|nr:hypothetical protein CSOJ01_07067 [Colletotrichum sojae]